MRKSALFFATMLGLGLSGCTADYTPMQAGGSGDDYDYTSDYAPYPPYVQYNYNRKACPWDDVNCHAVYDYPGGG